jgi:hypothetical protein
MAAYTAQREKEFRAFALAKKIEAAQEELRAAFAAPVVDDTHGLRVARAEVALRQLHGEAIREGLAVRVAFEAPSSTASGDVLDLLRTDLLQGAQRDAAISGAAWVGPSGQPAKSLDEAVALFPEVPSGERNPPIQYIDTPPGTDSPADCAACGSRATDHKTSCECHCHKLVAGHRFVPDPNGTFPGQCNVGISSNGVDSCCGYPKEKHALDMMLFGKTATEAPPLPDPLEVLEELLAEFKASKRPQGPVCGAALQKARDAVKRIRDAKSEAT